MVMPRPRPTLAMLQAEIETRRALEFAVREHERQVAAQEEAAIRQSMGERERGRTYRAPMREQGMSAPRVVQGLAQAGPLHRQDMQRYRNEAAPPQLTPAQQEALDAQHDYNREWLTRDEAGSVHLASKPSSAVGVVPMASVVERAVAQDEATRYVPKPAKKPKPMKVRT